MAIFKKLFGMNPVGDEDEPDEEIQASDDGGENAFDDEELGELALDLYQTKDDLIIKSTIAGVKPEDLDITVAPDMISIQGERRKEEEIADEDYIFQECYWGGFSRALKLPSEIDVDHVAAEIRDGVLTLTLPKAAKTRTKKVKIKSE